MIWLCSIAGARCTEGSVTVVSDANNSSLQLVEMCSSEGVWSPACDSDWTLQDATVVCRQLGYPFLGKVMVLSGHAWALHQIVCTGNMKVLDAIEGVSDMIPDCSGTETNLMSCLSHIPEMSCDYLLVECSTMNPTGEPQPPVITISSQGPTPVITISSQAPTPVITATSTAQPTDIGRATDESGGTPIAVIAGVGVTVVIIVLILLVLLLLVVVCVKRNKQKGVRYTYSYAIHLSGSGCFARTFHCC